ncbi:MAG: pyridoxamine kinase [Clostridia bacterium]|nr:pyridoxamine kinase [Clostridia bacterium]
MPNPAPRAACIHDLSCFGRCSLTVALPVLSCMGICAVPLPAGIFSTHTGGFTDIAIENLDGFLPKVIDQWKNIPLSFDAVYTGFLASAAQFDLVEEFLDIFGKNTLMLVDPVMGDHGRLYSTYNEEMCRRAKRLACRADIITPNITEACILTGRPYTDKPFSLADAEGLTRELSRIAPRCCITGIITEDGRYGSAAFDGEENRFEFHAVPRLSAQMHGAGDLFASVLLGYMLRGGDFLENVSKTMEFLHIVCAHTEAVGRPTREGLEFEPFLAQLGKDVLQG